MLANWGDFFENPNLPTSLPPSDVSGSFSSVGSTPGTRTVLREDHPRTCNRLPMVIVGTSPKGG